MTHRGGKKRAGEINRGLVVAAVCMGWMISAGSAMAQQVTASGALGLIPEPRQVVDAGRVVPLAHGVSVVADSGSEADRFAAQDLAEWSKGLGIVGASSQSYNVRLVRLGTAKSDALLRRAHVEWDAAMDAEGYALVPEGERTLDVLAKSEAGIFYGVQTVKQLMRGRDGGTLRAVTLRDWPAMASRGFSDDLSRGAVPTMAYLKQQIRTFAAYKLNVYSPYFESSFAYQNSSPATAHGVGMTPDEGRELSAYAAKYHIVVVPEQESFGHLHRLLTSQQYEGVAELPQGSVLSPERKESLDLIGSWFTELADVFPGKLLHIGGDETFELGQGQTKAAAARDGLQTVYINFLEKVHQQLAPLNRRLLFWGDIAMRSPDEVKRLPKDMIAVAWVYEAHPEGYSNWIKPFTDAHMETWVAPSVNGFRRVYPGFDTSMQNIQGLAADGKKLGSTGLLNTSWNDDGETLFASNWYGVLYGAAAAWQQGRVDDHAFQASYGEVFHGDASGLVSQAQSELMAAIAPLESDESLQATDLLFWADPWSPMGRVLGGKLAPLIPAMRLHAEKAITLLHQARKQKDLREDMALDAMELGARRLDFIGQKFQAAGLISSRYDQAFAAQANPKAAMENMLTLFAVGGWGGLSEDIRDGYIELQREYVSLWDRMYRPYYRGSVEIRYQESALLWQSRSRALFQALVIDRSMHRIPPLSSLGLTPSTETPKSTEQR